MELLCVIIVVLIVIGNAAQSEKKKAQKAKETAKQLGHSFNNASDVMSALTTAAKAQQGKTEHSQPQTVPEERMVQEVAQPQVHTHLAAACKEHDAPGSLGKGSMEGKDPCHEEQLPPMKAPRPEIQLETEETSGLQLDWSGENMVRAFVMQEILTRPCDRRRGA